MVQAAEAPEERLSPEDLQQIWSILSRDERLEAFRLLPREEAEDFFLVLAARDQAALVLDLGPQERRSWLRLLPPDDAADLVQAAPPDQAEALLALVDEATRREVRALLAYAEDAAGGLMNTRFARVRPDMTVDEAISYLRRQAREQLEQIYYVYVLDEAQHLLGVVSFRELFSASPEKRVRDVMNPEVVSVREDEDQEIVSNVFAQLDLVAIPVVDAENRVKGIVTIDDIVDVVQEEATEDIQKFGGVQVLEAPYLEIGLGQMVRKRGIWLAALFVGGMVTAAAMSFFEEAIARAVVLATFVPLIISSGGNTGSQASTLVIRAIALGELRMRDWWRVMRRELATGAALGAGLGSIGFLRIVLGEWIAPGFGASAWLVALLIFGSVLGVVVFGALAGAFLPFALKRLGFDPADASAPFIATLVDIFGIIIYFGMASLLLAGVTF
jgi:magnesium transporter